MRSCAFLWITCSSQGRPQASNTLAQCTVPSPLVSWQLRSARCGFWSGSGSWTCWRCATRPWAKTALSLSRCSSLGSKRISVFIGLAPAGVLDIPLIAQGRQYKEKETPIASPLHEACVDITVRCAILNLSVWEPFCILGSVFGQVTRVLSGHLHFRRCLMYDEH